MCLFPFCFLLYDSDYTRVLSRAQALCITGTYAQLFLLGGYVGVGAVKRKRWPVIVARLEASDTLLKPLFPLRRHYGHGQTICLGVCNCQTDTQPRKAPGALKNNDAFDIMDCLTVLTE